MKLSMETCVLRDRFGDETALEMIRKAGFDAFDYSLYWVKKERDMLGEDYRERAQKLRARADSLGLVCNQAHAPFDIKREEALDLSREGENWKRLVRSLEVASLLGARTIVVHALYGENFEEINRTFYRRLIPYCEAWHISVAVENLFDWTEEGIRPVLGDPQAHQDFVKSLQSPWFTVCLDVGHSAITGYMPETVITAMDASQLTTLHIHDNDKISDRHGLPFTGDLDWNHITEALRKIGYAGDMTFEIFGFLEKLDNSLLPEALVFAEQVGRRLIAMTE